jgi:integrase
LVRLLGAHELCTLKVDDVQKYCLSRLEEGAARETVRKELVVLRSTLSLARDRGMLTRDPDALIPKFRAPYRPKRRWLSEPEIVELLKNLPDERKSWVLLAVFTGGRLSELESLTWGDLNFGKAQIHIRGTKTARSDRFIPMDPELAELLLPLRAEADQPVAGKWRNVRRDLRKACEKAGIEPVSPNDLRRTFASWLKQAGRDSLAVGKLLGHTSSRMVELVYGHLDQKTLQQAMEALPSLSALTGPNLPPELRN